MGYIAIRMIKIAATIQTYDIHLDILIYLNPRLQLEVYISFEPFNRRPIYSMGLSYSLDSLSSERARPMYSIFRRVRGTEEARSLDRRLIIINWILSFENLALSNVAGELSSKWAGPYFRRLSRALDNPSSGWAFAIRSKICRGGGFYFLRIWKSTKMVEKLAAWA